MSYIFSANRPVGQNGQFIGNEEIEESALDKDGWRWWFADGLRMKRIYCVDGFEFGSKAKVLDYIRSSMPEKNPRSFIAGLPRLPDRHTNQSTMRSRKKQPV